MHVSSARSLAVIAIWLALPTPSVSQDIGKWRLNSSETCEGRQAIIERIGRETQVHLAATAVTVGQAIEVRWTRGRFPEREPIYLMLSFDQPVRLSGEAFYGLLPNAIAAFEIGWDANRTRAVVPFYGFGVPNEGAIEVRPLLAVPLTMRWAVTGYDGCGERASGGLGEARIEVRTSGAPEIVVNDPFALGAPQTIWVSPDGTRRLAVHEGRYRLLDAATGTEVAERVGTDPRFSPTGRFVAARGESGAPGKDNFEVLDAVDGMVVVATSGVALAWDNADSLLVVDWGGAGMIGTHDLATGREIPVRVWTNCRVCGGFEATGYYADLENNAVIIAGPQGARAATLSTQLVSDQLEGGDAQRYPGEIRSFVTATSAVIPVTVPERWQFRTGLRFSHISSFSPGDAALQVEQAALGGAKADASNGGSDKGSQLVALNWRGLARQEADTCAEAGRGLARVDDGCPVEAETTKHGAASVGCEEEQRGFERPGNPCAEDDTKALAAMQGSIIERLRGIGLNVVASSSVASFVAPYAIDPEFGYRIMGSNSAEVQKLQSEVNLRIAAETGISSDRFVEPDSLCEVFEAKNISNRFDVAWRWEHGGGVYWLTTGQCAEGSAAFLYPHTELYSSTVPGKRINLDLLNAATNCGTCCDMSLDACGFDAKIFGDRLLIYSTEAAGFGIFDVKSGATVVKRFGLPRADLFDNVLLTEDGAHVVALNEDGSFTLVRIADGETVLEGRYADDEVVVWTPDRRFDATAEGAHFVSFKFPGRIGEYTFQQFEGKLRVPGLVEAVLSGTYEAASLDLAPPPSLSATIDGGSSPAGHSAEGFDSFDLSARAVGAAPLAGLQIFQDGLLTERLAAPADEVAAEWDQPIGRLPGTRWVSLVASDANGVVSLPMGRDLGPDPRAKRRLNVLAIGVDRFEDARIPPLAVAEADARTFSAAIATAAGAEGSDLSVASETLLLGDEASPARILAAIERLVTSSARGETAAIFFAGHGVQGPDGAYYLATAGTNVDDFPGTAVPWASVADLVAKANTRVAIFLDSCHSGMAGRTYFATNDDAAESILDRVPSGVVIFSASKGREEAGEDAALGGGFFTKALENAIASERTATDRDGNGAIEISELFGAVKRFVVERTAGKQTPWFARNQMVGDFALF